MPIHVGVLTVSDRCSRDEALDESGPIIVDALPAELFRVVQATIVPDDRELIAATLISWSDDFNCDVILTTGGTGFASRDVTPEATTQVIDRFAQNIATYLLIESLKVTPFAALGRGVAGIRNRTLIVNLPGSPKGARQQAEILIPFLKHAVALLRDQSSNHPNN